MILLKLFAKKNLSEPRFLLPLSLFCPWLLPAVCYQMFLNIAFSLPWRVIQIAALFFIKPLLEMPKCLCGWEGGSAKSGSNQERLLLMLCELSGAFFCAKLFSGSLKGRWGVLGSKWSSGFHSPVCLWLCFMLAECHLFVYWYKGHLFYICRRPDAVRVGYNVGEKELRFQKVMIGKSSGLQPNTCNSFPS